MAAATIVVLGIFAALDQLGIAPNIVRGLFYAALAVVAGSAIVAIGGGGIKPMQARWERMLDRVASEAPQLKAQATQTREVAQQKTAEWKERAEEWSTQTQERAKSAEFRPHDDHP
jgi:hypothetical protein